jgi:hypothetical protein
MLAILKLDRRRSQPCVRTRRNWTTSLQKRARSLTVMRDNATFRLYTTLCYVLKAACFGCTKQRPSGFTFQQHINTKAKTNFQNVCPDLRYLIRINRKTAKKRRPNKFMGKGERNCQCQDHLSLLFLRPQKKIMEEGYG